MIENHWCITKDTKVKPAWWWEGDRRYRGEDMGTSLFSPQPVVSEPTRPQDIVSLKAELKYCIKKLNELQKHRKVESPY